MSHAWCYRGWGIVCACHILCMATLRQEGKWRTVPVTGAIFKVNNTKFYGEDSIFSFQGCFLLRMSLEKIAHQLQPKLARIYLLLWEILAKSFVNLHFCMILFLALGKVQWDVWSKDVQISPEHHTGKCIRRFAGIYAYCRYFIDRKWLILVLILNIKNMPYA